MYKYYVLLVLPATNCASILNFYILFICHWNSKSPSCLDIWLTWDLVQALRRRQQGHLCPWWSPSAEWESERVRSQLSLLSLPATPTLIRRGPRSSNLARLHLPSLSSLAAANTNIGRRCEAEETHGEISEVKALLVPLSLKLYY